LQQVTDTLGTYTTPAAEYFRQLVAGLSVTASLVCDETGITVSKEGSSAGLGNETDLALLVALRRHAQVIVTSGKTLRADNYRFPKSADLAVLTNHEVDLVAPEGQKLLVSSYGYVQLVNELARSGYERIHVEYGITGMKEILEADVLDGLFLSSMHRSGVEELSKELKVSPIILELGDLYVGLVAWHSGRVTT
jgi:hypothetical protein